MNPLEKDHLEKDHLWEAAPENGAARPSLRPGKIGLGSSGKRGQKPKAVSNEPIFHQPPFAMSDSSKQERGNETTDPEMLVCNIAELSAEDLSDEEIARKVSSVGKAELIGAVRAAMSSTLKGLRDMSPTYLKRVLDEQQREQVEEGDYVVVQKEMHEQAYLVSGNDADSHEEAARIYLNEGPPMHGTPTYVRLLENENLRVRKTRGYGEEAEAGTEHVVDPSDL